MIDEEEEEEIKTFDTIQTQKLGFVSSRDKSELVSKER
jgi:hypothetical protein